MRPDEKNARKRVRLIVTVDAEGTEYEEVNKIFQLLRPKYEGRNLTVGGVRETKDTRRAG